MKISKSKINIAIGVSLGILVGFVFGAAYGTACGITADGDNTQGNVSELAKHRYNIEEAKESDHTSDTIKMNAIDNNGNNWTITLSK